RLVRPRALVRRIGATECASPASALGFGGRLSAGFELGGGRRARPRGPAFGAIAGLMGAQDLTGAALLVVVVGMAGHDERFMRMAMGLAQAAADVGEVPVGAVVVDEATGTVVATGANGPVGAHDPTAHAEIMALRAAALATGNYRLTGLT